MSGGVDALADVTGETAVFGPFAGLLARWTVAVTVNRLSGLGL